MSTHIPLATLPDTLDGLPPIVHRGLIAVAFFGILSLITSTTLFLYLTYRLSTWYFRGQLSQGPNQLLLLIYNLLLADIQQAMAFSLTAVYLARDKIEVGTTTCWANGWFVSTGDLASGVWIFSIALHTFFAVVKGRSISNRVLYLWIALCWCFVYALGIATVSVYPDIYVRAGAWCWVSRKHEAARLWLHYFWIFLVMGGTVITYLLIFLSIRAKARGSSQTTIRSNDSDPAVLLRATKYMVIFPVAYVVLTLPLAGGRMAAMTGVKIPFAYYCAAGAAITSCGWVDVTLYVLTRRVLVFGHAPPARDDFGFDTLGWRHGGQNDFFGTTTTIEGPLTPKPKYRRKEGRFLRRSTDRPLRTRHSDEDYFASPDPGTITTKTTVEVSTGAMPHYASSDPKYYAGSDLSIIELEDKPPRTQSPRFSNNHWLEISEENQARRS